MERVFATDREAPEMLDEQTISEAIDLVERLLDEITWAEPTWQAIEHLADALAKLAAAAGRRRGGEHGGRRGRDA